MCFHPVAPAQFCLARPHGAQERTKLKLISRFTGGQTSRTSSSKPPIKRKAIVVDGCSRLILKKPGNSGWMERLLRRDCACQRTRTRLLTVMLELHAKSDTEPKVRPTPGLAVRPPDPFHAGSQVADGHNYMLLAMLSGLTGTTLPR